VNSAVILGVAWKARNFLTSWVTVRFWRSKLFHVVKDRRLISTSMSFPKRTRLSSPNHSMSQCDRNKNDYFTVRNCFALTVIAALVFSENICSCTKYHKTLHKLHLTLSGINFRSSLPGRGNTKWTASCLTQPVVKQQCAVAEHRSLRWS